MGLLCTISTLFLIISMSFAQTPVQEENGGIRYIDGIGYLDEKPDEFIQKFLFTPEELEDLISGKLNSH